MNSTGSPLHHALRIAVPLLFAGILATYCPAQSTTAAPTPDQKQEAPKPSEPEKNPAQIELLETKYRFETNGDSRKEVHARVKINNELGVSQFARLNFDFNRSFQSVEIPQVRITHPSGGIADILPSAITDNPNPAVVDFPAYQDVRVKSVRILGLQPGDLLEYRVITTTAHHPLAPDFWCEHTFDRTGVVSREIFELDLPTSRKPQIHINSAMPSDSTDSSTKDDSARSIYRWNHDTSANQGRVGNESEEDQPDVVASTETWLTLSIRLDEKLTPGAKPLETLTYEEQLKEMLRKQTVSPELSAKAHNLTQHTVTSRAKLEALYEFVSQKITTIDLPLGSTGFVGRQPHDILASRYATPEDKFVLFAALVAPLKFSAEAALTGYCDAKEPARPSAFNHLLISAYDGVKSFWLDPSIEVAPFGLIPVNSGKCVFVLNRDFYSLNSTGHEWQKLTAEAPFSSVQKVSVAAVLSSKGQLTSKVHYSLRGDNELLLRVAFHKTPKDKWKDVAQLLAISDGFRGEITNVTASDPYATKEPFTVEYEITQPKFVDWSKKPVRIPALLPLPGLPDPPSSAGNSTSAAKKPIDLGTPLEIELEATVQLPEGTTALAPTGTAVTRDYATFSSKYSAQGNTLHAARKLNFIAREIPATRAGDLNAFLRAVQSDQSQLFTLQPPPQK
ncbi:MAG TPA: DUF3857 domain-containing protein [Candidatus Acidoferrum sp.]